MFYQIKEFLFLISSLISVTSFSNSRVITSVKPSHVDLFVNHLTQHEVIKVPLVCCRFKVRIVVKDKYGMGMMVW